MRHIMLTFVAGLAVTTAAPAVAAKGDYSSALRKMLTQAAAGTCPADIMGEGLLKACTEQIPKMQPALAAAGPITSMTFIRTDTVKGRRIEAYKVSFQKGEPQIWHIGGLKDGKFQAAYNDGK